MGDYCDKISILTDCNDVADYTKCNECKNTLYRQQCRNVSFKKDCSRINVPVIDGTKDSSEQDTCYACQNWMYSSKVMDGDLDNGLAQTAQYRDSVNIYGNEYTKTFYIVIGIVGILTCSYYIR
jgi:hypothetical protein